MLTAGGASSASTYRCIAVARANAVSGRKPLAQAQMLYKDVGGSALPQGGHGAWQCPSSSMPSFDGLPTSPPVRQSFRCAGGRSVRVG